MKLWTKAVLMLFGVVLVAGRVASLFAEDARMDAPYTGSAQFEKMKKLVGVWEGTSKMEKGEEKVRVEYQISSGGSSLVEKLFPGTPHEMVSIYYDQGGKLCMTHYCMLHNRPQMELKKAGDNQLKFELARGSGIKPKETHMHSLNIIFQDEDHITQNWTLFVDGKEKNVKTLVFSRVRQP